MATSPQDLMRLQVVTVSNGCTDPPDVRYEWYNRHSFDPNGVTEMRPDNNVSEIDQSGCPVCVVAVEHEDLRQTESCGYDEFELPDEMIVTFPDDITFSGDGDGLTCVMEQSCYAADESLGELAYQARRATITWAELTRVFATVVGGCNYFVIRSGGAWNDPFQGFTGSVNPFSNVEGWRYLGTHPIELVLDTAFPGHCDAIGPTVTVSARVFTRVSVSWGCDGLFVSLSCMAGVFVGDTDHYDDPIVIRIYQRGGEVWAGGIFNSWSGPPPGPGAGGLCTPLAASIPIESIPATLEDWPLTLAVATGPSLTSGDSESSLDSFCGASGAPGDGVVTLTPAFMWVP